MPRPQHVGQLPHLLGVGNGLIEGEREIVAAQNGQIGVVAFQLLVAVAVDHRQVVVVVLLAGEAAGDLVLEGPGPAHQLGLIQHTVHRLHDLVAHLHPHADVHGSGLVGNIVLGTQALQPVRPPAAGGDDRMAAGDFHLLFAVGGAHPPADRAVQNQVGAFVPEEDLHAVFQQMPLDGVVQLLGLLGAQMADGAVHQLQPRPDGPLADGLDLLGVAQALHVAVRAELQINFVCVIDGLLGLLRADEAGQVPAHLVAEGQLSVGKSAGAGKTGGDMAIGPAAYTLAGLILGTPALLHRPALLHNENFLPAALFQHFQGGKNARRARADDHNVFVHGEPPFRSAHRAGVVNGTEPSVSYRSRSRLSRRALSSSLHTHSLFSCRSPDFRRIFHKNC